MRDESEDRPARGPGEREQESRETAETAYERRGEDEAAERHAAAEDVAEERPPSDS